MVPSGLRTPESLKASRPALSTCTTFLFSTLVKVLTTWATSWNDTFPDLSTKIWNVSVPRTTESTVNPHWSIPGRETLTCVWNTSGLAAPAGAAARVPATSVVSPVSATARTTRFIVPPGADGAIEAPDGGAVHTPSRGDPRRVRPVLISRQCCPTRQSSLDVLGLGHRTRFACLGVGPHHRHVQGEVDRQVAEQQARGARGR